MEQIAPNFRFSPTGSPTTFSHVPKIHPKHPGVSIYRRGDRGEWFAEWRENGVRHRKSLTAIGLTAPLDREVWAARVSRRLRAAKSNSRAALHVSDAVEHYLADCERELKPSTLRGYRETAQRFLEFAERRGLRTVSSLTPADVAAFRSELLSAEKQTSKAGGKKGESVGSSTARSPHTANRHIATAAAMLGRWRAAGMTPELSRDSITDALRKARSTAPAPQPLTPAEMKQLLVAAMRFDERSPRNHHKRPAGVAAFTAFVLLTGCRSGEACSLQWDAVKLDDPPVVRFAAADTKTRRGREIDLTVSPGLVGILRALRPKHASGYVFGGATAVSASTAASWRKWLQSTYGGPEFSWQQLRQTCASYLCNAPGIFGAAAVFREAKQLGHSVVVAERHYAGVIRGISPKSKTLESAMGTEAEIALIRAAVGTSAPP